MKTILIVTGSPRSGGNSALLADAFARGAEEKGHRVQRFDAAFRSIAGCTACDRCWTRGKACVIEDDWQQLSEKLEQADVVVFAYPLYWSGMPAQLKAAVDRLYSYCSDKTLRPLTGKQTVLLLCGECEGQEIFNDARRLHEGLNGYFAWQPAGEVTVDGVFERGAVERTDALRRAYELGASF